MANVLLFEPGPKGEYAPGFPRGPVDGPTLERQARIRGMTTDEYTAAALALRYSNGKPMFRAAPKAPEEVKELAAEVRAEKPKVALGQKHPGS